MGQYRRALHEIEMCAQPAPVGGELRLGQAGHAQRLPILTGDIGRAPHERAGDVERGRARRGEVDDDRLADLLQGLGWRPGTQATSSRSITSSEPSRKAACEAIPARWCSHMWSSGVRTSSGRSPPPAWRATKHQPDLVQRLGGGRQASSRQEHARWRRSSRRRGQHDGPSPG